MGYLYMLSNDRLYEMGIVKLGYSNNCIQRLSNFQTLAPPEEEYKMIKTWKVNSKSRTILHKFEKQVHDYFRSYHMERKMSSGTEWYSFGSPEKAYKLVDNYIKSCKFYKKPQNKNKNIFDSSAEYELHHGTPCPVYNETWYDHFHPYTDKITIDSFKKLVKKQNFKKAIDYDIWRELQPFITKTKLPSTQHILDGYFGNYEINVFEK